MNDPSVEEAIKQLVLANADGEIKSLVYVMINKDNEPELQIAVNAGNMYSTITALEILKVKLIERLIDQGDRPAKDRE